jgi:cobalt-zinc-cadmium efflux system membrane fusion protein
MRFLVAVALSILTGAGGTYWYLAGAGGHTSAGPHNHDAAFCTTHQLPEADCPFCHPELVADGGECAGHGVPEVLCFRCRPQLAAAFKAEGDWCASHDQPESQCDVCNPGEGSDRSAAATPQTPSLALEPITLDDLPRRARPPSVTCATGRNTIRLASADTARDIGLEFQPVDRRPLHQTLTVNAEVVFDATRFARLASRAAGVIQHVNKNTGDIQGQRILRLRPRARGSGG